MTIVAEARERERRVGAVPPTGTVQTSSVPSSSGAARPLERAQRGDVDAVGRDLRVARDAELRWRTPGTVGSTGHGPHDPPQRSSAHACVGHAGTHAAAWQAPSAQPNVHGGANVSNVHPLPSLQLPGARDVTSVVASAQRGAGATAHVQSASTGTSGPSGPPIAASVIAASTGGPIDPSAGAELARDEHARNASAVATA